MSLTRARIESYRSVRDLALPFEPLTVLVGANGVGKTNLYRALELVRSAATGTIARDIVEEGGVESVLWAGPRRRGAVVRLKLSVELGDFGYGIDIGLPAPTEAALPLEPLVKAEVVTAQVDGRKVTMLERRGPSIRLRGEDGRRELRDGALLASETALANLADVERFPVVATVRHELQRWRFYHGFRVDTASPLRAPCSAVATPTLANDGADLAAALETVRHIRADMTDIDEVIDEAFPGASLTSVTEAGRSRLSLKLADMPRALAAHELSDGTLRYLALVAALAGYRLPSFIALNEPEASLHPTLLEPLARLISRAASQSRVLVVTHAETLANAIAEQTGILPRRVIKSSGATTIEGLRLDGSFDD